MSNKVEMTASQRAQFFGMSTRQNMHMLARETASVTPSTLQFTLPKSRLLSSLLVKVKVEFQSAESRTLKAEEVYGLIRRISLDLNNGFSPFVVSGRELYLYNLVSVNGNAWNDEEITLPSAQAGSSKNFELVFELPVTLNGRDPVGLILLQSDQTNVTLSIDTANYGSIFPDDTFKGMSVDVMTTTYSIPANANAYPDLSVLKLVSGRQDALPTAGQQIVKLATGTIYRKILFRLVDENGQPMTKEDVSSNFELVFNQADVNYSISADMLRTINTKLLGYELPEGVYCFDFSNAGGFVNMGGTRDYIDTAKLTEFWLRFTTGKRGKIEIVTECLARLTGNA